MQFNLFHFTLKKGMHFGMFQAGGQSWGSYFLKVANILHITSYFIMDVVYYSYILLKIQCNLLILHIKLLNKTIITL